MPRSEASFPSPFGPLTVTVVGEFVTALRWGGAAGPSAGLLAEAGAQLAAYFAGGRRAFDLPLAFPSGLTGRVMRQICAIPYGQTRSYGDLARALEVPAQAIGQGCGANPIPVIVPCHRVLGATGLGGYSGAGGIETKVALLKHEGAASLLL